MYGLIRSLTAGCSACPITVLPFSVPDRNLTFHSEGETQ